MHDFYPLYWGLCQPLYWGCVKIIPFLISCFLEYKRHRFLISEPSVPPQKKSGEIYIYIYIYIHIAVSFAMCDAQNINIT